MSSTYLSWPLRRGPRASGPPSHPSSWHAALLGIALSALAAAACQPSASGPPSEEECAALRDHAIDVRLSSMGRQPAEAVLDQHREHLAAAAGPALIDRCVRDADRRRFDCAMAAATPAELEACRTAPR